MGEKLFNGTVLINSKRPKLEEGYFFTDADCHLALHEIIHKHFPKLLSFNTKEIPLKYKNVKDKLSTYSSGALIQETAVELLVKKLINGLNKEEEVLLKFLSYFA